MKLTDIDPALLEGMKLPGEFAELVYFPEQVIDLLGTTIDEFWLAVRVGRVPCAVWLPSNPPHPCWDRQVIDTWIAAGQPVPEDVVAHNYVVLTQLVECVKNTLPKHALTRAERN